MTRAETPAEVQAVLDAAADLLERDGWCQDTFFDYKGRRCIRRAIGDCGPTRSLRYQAANIVRERVDSMFLTEWNDAKGRTAAEVIAALRGES